MEDDYTITVNTFNGSFTGHVNITLTGPDGWTHTFGNNTTDGSWGVREEFNDGRTDMHSTTYPATYEQVMAMYNWVAGILGDPNNSYGLLGQNCVDFVRDMFSVAGLTNQISSLMQWLNMPVNYYAAITDWLESNGFGPIMDGIGATLGAFGELGSIVINAAGDAWNWASDMATAAWDLIGNLGDAVGGFVGSLADSIADFFRNFGKGNDEGTEQQETEEGAGRSASGSDYLTLDADEFVLAFSDDQGPSRQVLEFSDEKSFFTDNVEIFVVAANDAAVLDIQPSADEWAIG